MRKDAFLKCYAVRPLRCMLCAFVVAAATITSAADNYPARPIRVLIPGPPGVGIDVDARPIAQKMSELLGQTLVMENRPAAGGVVAMELVSKAPPDGYTLIVAGIGPLAAFPYLYRKLSYDPDRDFVAVSLMQVLPAVLTIHPSVGAKSVQELVAMAKARPGSLTFASQGNGTFVHLAGELFKAVTGTDIRHVPYGQQSPFIDLAGGHVQMMFSGIAPVIGNVQAGRLRILAVSAKQRVAVIGDVPTFIESGVPGYDASAWNGLVAPRGTPAAILTRLQVDAAKAVVSPEVKDRMLRFGGIPVGGTPQEFSAFLRAERAKWGKLINDSKLQLD
jgi:tripartite-type tricarboxylate transporter receptor subunit TctC